MLTNLPKEAKSVGNDQGAKAEIWVNEVVKELEEASAKYNAVRDKILNNFEAGPDKSFLKAPKKAY